MSKEKIKKRVSRNEANGRWTVRGLLPAGALANATAGRYAALVRRGGL